MDALRSYVIPSLIIAAVMLIWFVGSIVSCQADNRRARRLWSDWEARAAATARSSVISALGDPEVLDFRVDDIGGLGAPSDRLSVSGSVTQRNSAGQAVTKDYTVVVGWHGGTDVVSIEMKTGMGLVALELEGRAVATARSSVTSALGDPDVLEFRADRVLRHYGRDELSVKGSVSYGDWAGQAVTRGYTVVVGLPGGTEVLSVVIHGRAYFVDEHGSWSSVPAWAEYDMGTR